MDGDEGTTRTSDTQLTEEAQGGYCSNLSLREAMRHPQLHFQNLLSPTAFGRLWEHDIGLSSCLQSLVSFCAYSLIIKGVSRSKGFKLIPPNKK